jgi:gliding motility-associated-like protein
MINRLAILAVLACLPWLAGATHGAASFPEFVSNQGQWEGGALYRADVPGGVFWAEADGFTFSILGEGWADFGHEGKSDEPIDESRFGVHHYKMHFDGASIPAVAGEKKHAHHYNFYLGDDPARWTSGVPIWQKLRYNELYEGIDLVMYGKENRLKYDFKVAPGADPSRIVLRYEGVDQLALANGNLVIKTSVRDIVEMAPFAYQMVNGVLKEIDCVFVVDGDRVHFELGDYNRDLPLVIDPEIAFSTFVGATASNFGFTATDDPDGNLVAGACVFQAGYPTTLGAVQTTFEFMVNSNCDVAVSKFSADGAQLLYSTYLGGNGLEMPHSVICDSAGNIIVMGTTGSTNFPTTAGAFQPNLVGGPLFSFSTFFIQGSHQNGCDFFVTKFNADNSGLLASTYVGGTGNDGLNMADRLFYNYGDSFRGEVIVDEDDHIIVASTTNSSDFPMGATAPQMTYGGGQDGIVFKLTPNLNTLEWASYIGGPQADAAYSVQIDNEGALVVTGGTRSVALPTTANAVQPAFGGDVDAFIYRYSVNLQTLAAATYLGTPGYDQAYFVQLDADDNIYVVGQTEGNWPITAGVYGNPNSGQVLVKLNHELTAIAWQTTIGTGSGAIDISPTAFLVSDCDQIYFSGWGGLTNVQSSNYATQSTTINLPITADAYQSTTDGSDFYLCVLAPDATELAYATFLGGPLSREHVDGGTSKFDKNGNVYQAVCAGCGGNSDFPFTQGAWSAVNPSTNCNLAVFKFDLAKIEAEIAIDGPTEVCQNAPADFSNLSLGADTYLWTFGGAGTSTAFEPTFTFTEPGSYEVMMIASHTGECMDPDTAYIQIQVIPAVVLTAEPVQPICEGESVQLEASGSANLFWLPDPTLSATDIPNPIATPTDPVTTYVVIDSNECGGVSVEVVVEWVQPTINVSDDATICIGESVNLTASGGSQYQWSPPDYLSNPFAANPTATPLDTITYALQIITLEGCVFSEEVTINVDFNAPPGEQYPDVYGCIGQTVTLSGGNALAWSWTPAELCNNPLVQNPIVTFSGDTWFYVDITNACGSGRDSVQVIEVIPQAFAGFDGAVCLGDNHPVSAWGGASYLWVPQLWVADPEAAETTVSPPDDQVFTVYVTDEFGCTATAEVNVTVLPLPYVEAGPDRVLNWLDSDYLFGTADGIDFWWEPDLWIDCDTCITPITTPDANLWYSLYTIDGNGCRNVDSVYVYVYHPLYVPNTFTPNSDGINEVFRAYGENIVGFRMEIRNRWGELIFVSEDIEHGWSGVVHDGEHYVQIDTYLWTVYYDTKEGRKQLQGHVNVLR